MVRLAGLAWILGATLFLLPPVVRESPNAGLSGRAHAEAGRAALSAAGDHKVRSTWLGAAPLSGPLLGVAPISRRGRAVSASVSALA